MASNIDIVYPLKEDDSDYLELKYSLRSLKNYQHKNVYLVGGKPSWVKNVKHIPFNDSFLDPQHNVLRKLYAISKNDQISQRFILMNDDFFILRKVKKIHYFYTGTYYNFLKRQRSKGESSFLSSADKTWQMLANYPNPKNYGVHVPIMFDRNKLKSMMEGLGNKIYHLRSMYGNYYNVRGNKMNDVKAKDIRTLNMLRNGTFISVTDDFFRSNHFSAYIHNQFPSKSEYEK